MTNQSNVIYILIIIALTAVTTYFITRDTGTEFHRREQELLNRIDSLNAEIISVQSLRKGLDQDIIALNGVVNVLRDSISDTEARIKKIKREYDKKISDIDKYSADDVAKYFADRYGK